MADGGFRREIRKLLSEVDAAREDRRAAERQEVIARLELRRGFVRARDELLVPALRELMHELERRGHQTRLERRSETQLRLHVQLSGRRAVQAVVDAELAERAGREPAVRFAVVRAFQLDLADEVPLAELSEATVAAVVVRCLSVLAARAAD